LALENLDLLNSVLLDLSEADSQDAIFEYGFDLFFLNRYGKAMLREEFTPIALLAKSS
jgi:hypothetical protein